MAARKKATTTQQTVIEPISIRYAQITIEGETSLILHKFSDKARREIEEKQQGKAKKAREFRNPIGDFIESMWWMPETIDLKPEVHPGMEYQEFLDAREKGAKIGFQTTGIKLCAATAAYRSGAAKNVVSILSAFQVMGDLAEIVGDIHFRKDYCKIPMAGADIVYRGEVDPGWRITFTIAYNARGAYSLEQIVNFINLGGFACGLGDWRPEKSGNHGMFHVLGAPVHVER